MSLGNVSLTPQLVQAVRDAVDIVQVASEHTRLRKAGRRYSGLCPIHREKSPSFSVDPDQGLFYCFGCGAGGDAIKLHMLLSGDDFPAAIEALALRHGIPLPTRTEGRKGPGGREGPDLERALQAAAEFFTDQLGRNSVPSEYLSRRRIPGELIVRFGLGYAPDGWHNLAQALHPRIPLADLTAAGLVGKNERGETYDRFRHRLMFPIHNAAGRLVGFGGRTLGDDQAKYVNTAETDRFHKGLLLYGLHQAKREIRETGRAVLVEGYFDVIGSAASGVEGAVAGMGTALTPEQAKLLARYAEEAVVAYDGDSAGENAFRRALPLLLAEKVAVRRARFPEGHDPDSLRLAEGEDAVRKAIEGAADAVVLEIERLVPLQAARDPQAQAKAAAAIAEMLRPIPDAVLRFGYARIAADRLGLPVELFARRLGVAASQEMRQNLEAQPGEVAQAEQRQRRGIEESFLRALILPDPDIPRPALEGLPREREKVLTIPEHRGIYLLILDALRSTGSYPNTKEITASAGAEGAADELLACLARITANNAERGKQLSLHRMIEFLNNNYFKRSDPEEQRQGVEAAQKGNDELGVSKYEERKVRKLQKAGIKKPKSDVS